MIPTMAKNGKQSANRGSKVDFDVDGDVTDGETLNG
jgi:hypothetical protein